MSPLADGDTVTVARLVELLRYHEQTLGDEEIDLRDWLDEETADDAEELARIVELVEGYVAALRTVQTAVKDRLAAVLAGGAVRTGDVVYVEGAGSGRWKPRPELWTWLVRSFGDGVLDRYLDEIVSGIRVTAIDKVAAEADISEEAVRNTMLDYSPGRYSLQRKDLSVEAVARSARNWWPEADGQVTRPNREETT